MKLRGSMLGAALLAASLVVSAEATRPYTVDDMLSLESIGTARFDPAGNILLFDRYGPFDQQSDFSRQFVVGERRSKIYRVDLSTTEAPRPLFAQQPADGYTLGTLSPDGAYVTHLRLFDHGLAVGVTSLDGKKLTPFDLAPEYTSTLDLPWIDGHRLPYQALPKGEVAMSAGIGAEKVDELVGLWKARNVGRVATSAQIGSGEFKSLPASKSQLVLADARDGSTTTLASGEFDGYFASADGTVLVALRKQRLLIEPGKLIQHDANMGGIQRELLVFDSNRPGAMNDPCAGCDVLASSLNWSAKAPLLSFFARPAGDDWAQAQFHTYDHRTGKAQVVALDTLVPHVGRGGGMTASSAWLGEKLAVFAEARRGDEQDKPSRADWYLLDGAVPRNLTAGFEGKSPELIALGEESLIVLHGGDTWQVHIDGTRRNLTAEITGEVKEWREPSAYGRRAPLNLQPASTLTLEQVSTTESEPDRLLFVDLASGRIDTVTASAKQSEFIAASPAGRRAALIEKSDNQAVLVTVDAAGSRRELTRLNSHLKGVAGGTPVRIDHKGPKGDERHSWLLLPPGYKAGTRLPTVAIVYPGASGNPTWTTREMDDVFALNEHILAAQGYAVLYPTIPVAYHEVPRDPLDGLVDEVVAAVDAAVARGYVDADRLAVQGQSYGGYTTGALVGLTDRFKSAVAMAGLYNLISSYGQFDERQRLYHEKTGLDLFAVSLMETDQGGMGAPPWEDPERYLRASPLMYVKNIKTPIMLLSGDMDYISTTQTEEFFTALTRLDKDAVLVRYYGEGHVYNSPANIRDMWDRMLAWYEKTLGPPVAK